MTHDMDTTTPCTKDETAKAASVDPFAAIKAFRCPRYEELPDMGLYLEQMLGVVNAALDCLVAEPITKPMMGNYVKNGVVPPAVRKRYYREHLAHLFVMAILKPVFSVEQVARFFEIQRATYPLQVAYDFFCTEFENALHEAFEFSGKALPCVETKRTDETILVRSMVLAAANRVFVEKKLALQVPREVAGV
ncbi:MAG: DUF1836 domain-containing protein [Coriobacteriia bacterium]|nr:DUF1836 domain-containing protein [Coriobacteriia bacterium]